MGNWPQYATLIYAFATICISLGVYASGSEKTVTLTPGERFWLRLTGFTIVLFVLWRGGFFAPIGWPA